MTGNSVEIDRAKGEITFFDEVSWDGFGDDRLDWVKTIQTDDSLGPIPPGKCFSNLRTLITRWSEDMVPWLSCPKLNHLMVLSPTNGTLAALDGTKLHKLRLERPKKLDLPVQWPDMPHLKDLELYGWKTIDFAGAYWPALNSMAIDSAHLVLNLHVPSQARKLGWVRLDDVRQVEAPIHIWDIKAREVSAGGYPNKCPWLLEAAWLHEGAPDNAAEVTFPPVILERLAKGVTSEFTHIEHLEDDLDEITFNCGSLPVEDTLEELGYSSTGDFWAALIWHRHPLFGEYLELDPEQDFFSASGHPGAVRAVQAILELLLSTDTALKSAVRAAEAAGMDLNKWGG